MKKFLCFFVFIWALGAVCSDTLTVYMRSYSNISIRTKWDEKNDLLLLCTLGQNNKQFNFRTAYFVPKTLTMESLRRSFKLPPTFHHCGDSTGVMHMYPDPAKNTLYILSGNHGFNGSTITLPGHKFTQADIGRKFKEKHWIVRIDSKDKFSIIPAIRQREVPEAQKVQMMYNFRGTRILEQKYFLDGKEIKPGAILKGKVFTVLEKSAICNFEALAASKFRHDLVNDFYAVYEIAYHFYPNSSCRVDTRITFPKDICLMGVSPMQDSDMNISGFDFYEKYIPKVKVIQEPAGSDWRKAQVFYRPKKQYMTDSRRYDFAAVQDLTAIRKTVGPAASRFQILVKGGYVDPNDQPDRWIEFVGKNENGKRVRKIAAVLGLDTEHGIFQKSERAKNKSAFILPNWHKTYPTQFARGRTILKAGTVLEAVGYRCYFNPEKIGDATSLFTIPVKDGKKVYADFHKNVKGYVLPFPADAQTVIMEKSPGVTLRGNKLDVCGPYGHIVVKVLDKN